MFRKLLSGLVCLGLVALAGSVSAQGVATLNGEWHVAKAFMNGQSVPDDVLASMSLNVSSSGEFTAQSGGLSSNGKFAVGSAADHLDVTIAGGADSGRALKAKWRMESGDLTIAYGPSGYPADFNSTSTNKLLVVYYASGPRPASAVASTGTPTPPTGNAAVGTPGPSTGGSNTMSVRE
jgi:uncharacterized protein (TIGR03067 family)